MKFIVNPTSCNGQSILESVERRNGNHVIAEVSIQLPTKVVEEIKHNSDAASVLVEIVKDWRSYMIGVGNSYPPSKDEYDLFMERMLANITDARIRCD